MARYKLLGKIKKENETFNVYVDEKHQKFYLRETEDGKLFYPTLKQFLELNEALDVNSKDSIYVGIDERKDGMKRGTHTREEWEKGGVFYKFKPKVMLPKNILGGGLVTLACALTLCGCSITQNGETIAEIRPLETLETVQNNDVTTTTTQTTTQSVVQTTYTTTIQPSVTQTTENFFIEESDADILEQLGFEINEIDDGVMILHKAQKNDGKIDIYCRNLEEFKRYAGIDRSISFGDLQNAVNTNSNIGDKYKEWISEGIANLQSSGEFNNFDFSVFYYNLNRLYTEEKSSDEIIEEAGFQSVAAFYDNYKGRIVVPLECEDKELFFHEIFGHATTGAYIEQGNNEITYKFDMKSIAVNKDENGDISCSVSRLGSGLEEGKAEYFASYAYQGFEPRYVAEAEEFRIFMELTGMSFTQAIESGLEGMVESLNNKGIGLVVDNIDGMDALCKARQNSEFVVDNNYLFENNMKNLYAKYAKAQIQQGRNTQDIQNEVSRNDR